MILRMSFYCLRYSFLIGLGMNVLVISGFAADKIVQSNGHITNAMIHLLGWTGVRIANDPVHPNPQWPEAKIILPSCKLTDVVPAINGDLDPTFSWRQKPKPEQKVPTPPERWEMMGDFTHQQAEMITQIALNELELAPRILPKQKLYQGILFLGAALPRVRTRLVFLNELINQRIDFKRVYILTGERPLSETAGETPHQLLNRHNSFIAIHPEWQEPKILPNDEGDMIKMVFDQSKHPELEESKISLIYTPKREGEARATTETTVFKWLELKNPKKGTYLAISNQPYVLYQELVMRRCLKQANREDIKVECVGPQVDSSLATSPSLQHQAAVLLDTLNRVCYELKTLQEIESK
jgi:hypothetical protein